MNTLSSHLQSILDNRLRYLSPLVAEALKTVDWVSETITIGKKYGIHIDDIEELVGVVMKSLIGMIAPEKFEQEIINATALSPQSAERMIEEMNRTIFEPIHEKIVNPQQNSRPLGVSGIIPESAPLEEENFFI